MARLGFVKRLADVRKKLKARLYGELASLWQGETSPDQAEHVLALFCRLSDLELEDGEGALERLLAGLPCVAANQIRAELRRLLTEEDLAQGRNAK